MTKSYSPALDRYRHVKLMAIPGLAGILGVVLYSNFAGSNTPPTIVGQSQATNVSPAQTHVVVPVSSIASSPSVATAKPTLRRWPSFDIAEIVATDPFHAHNTNVLVAGIAPSDSTQTLNSNDGNSGLIADGKENPFSGDSLGKVRAIYQDHSGNVAILGSRVVRPGDVLASGEIITEITPGEIIVKVGN